MEINLNITIYTKDNKSNLVYYKVYQSNVIPSIGAKIKDDVFAVAKEVIKIEMDYSKDQCFVELEPRCETHERIESGHIQEVFDLHNWKRK
jgi:hypothetical protein